MSDERSPPAAQGGEGAVPSVPLDALPQPASEVAERTRLEEALRESEFNFRAIFESIPVACLVMRVSDGVYTAVNDAFTTTTGYPRQFALGHTWRELNLWLEPEKRDVLLGRLLAEGSVNDAELRFRHADGGEFIGLLSARVIALLGLPHVLTVVRDITERRRAAEERTQLLEQLRQSQKMEAVGRLAGGVAHDFNNMLMVVTNVTDLLLAQLAPDAAMVADLEQIREAASRATGLTQQLLAFSRKQVLQPRELDLNRLVAELEKMLRLMLGERASLAIDLHPGKSPVLADQTQLTQVLLNLVINARDAMPDGGVLRVATHPRLLGPEDARRLGEVRPGAYVRLSVSDSGVGMDIETQRRAFEPFFTTKGQAGTGLGLATVYGIVRQSGGHVEIESAPGQGATFHVWLPALAPAPLIE